MRRTGLKVSEICLGTMTFGHTTDEAEAERIVDAAAMFFYPHPTVITPSQKIGLGID